MDKQIKELESKLKVMTDTLESEAKIPVKFRMEENERIKLESDIERTKNRIISLRKETEETDRKSNLKNMKNGFDGLYSSAKKLAFGILSIKTIYSILSRASSAYMATDTRTANQLEANWVGLGTILEPVIKFIIGLMKRAVTSVLYFMSVLTGVDYIAKANANALKKQASATNALKRANDKLTASFDEMEVLKTSDAKSSGAGLDTSALFDINDIGERARKTIDKIAKALKPVYKIIKKIIDWALENPEVIIGILGGVALLTMLSKIIGVGGVGGLAGTGLSGILGLLLAIASIGVITISILVIANSIIEAREATKKATENVQGLTKNTKDYTDTVKKLSEEQKLTNDQINMNANYLGKASGKSLELAQRYREQAYEGDLLRKGVSLITSEYDSLTSSSYEYMNQAYLELTAMGKLYEQGKLNDEQTKRYKENLQLFSDIVNENGKGIEAFSSKLGLNKKETEKLTKNYNVLSEQLRKVKKDTEDTQTPFQLVTDSIFDLSNKIKNLPTYKSIQVSADTSSARNTLNSFFSGFSTTITSIFGSKISFPKLAVGGIVNNPGRGVPVGKAIAGEVSKEGVIPLTDSQAMEELGSAIGRYITINLTNNTNLDGKTIARQQNKISANKEFAMNR